MPSVSLWAYSAEKLFLISRLSRSAERSKRYFHGRGRNGKRQLLRLLPPGGAVAQRLRGYQSAEPEKTVKRSSRRTGVNLQFFPVEPTSLGSSRACSPCPVAGWVESRGREGGVGTPLPASGPAERLCTLAASRNFPRSAQYAFPVLFWCQKRTSPALIFPHRTARTPVR